MILWVAAGWFRKWSHALTQLSANCLVPSVKSYTSFSSCVFCCGFWRKSDFDFIDWRGSLPAFFWLVFFFNNFWGQALKFFSKLQIPACTGIWCPLLSIQFFHNYVLKHQTLTYPFCNSAQLSLLCLVQVSCLVTFSFCMSVTSFCQLISQISYKIF